MASSNVHPYANHILRDGNHSQRLEDVPLLRRLMVELSYMLTTVDTPQDMEAMRNLPSLFRSQEQIIGNIMRAVQTDRSHTVLLQASLRFVAARHEGDEAILAATNELVTLASAPVLTNGAEHEEEYQAASRLLDERGVDVTLTDTELFSIAPGIHQSLSSSVRERREAPPAPDAASMPTNAEQPNTVQSRGSESQRTRGRDRDASPQHNSDEVSDGGFGQNMNPRVVKFYLDMLPQMPIDKEQDKTLHESDVADSEPHSRERRPTKATGEKRPASRQGNGSVPKKTKATGTAPEKKPKKSGAADSEDEEPLIDLDPSDDEDHSDTETNPDGLFPDEFLVYDPEAPATCNGEVIDDFTYSRETPELNQRNESLKLFEFNTEMPHPTKAGYRILGEPRLLRYLSDHDWTNERHKKNFRGWRNEKLNVNMGKRVAKDIFLKSEAEELTKLVKAALRKVGGRWSKVDWETMKKDLDFACRTDKKQQAGEPIEPLRFSFVLKGGMGSRHNVLSCGRLNKDRLYPKRVDQQRNENNAVNLEEVFRSFIDPRKKRIWRAAQEADRRAGGNREPIIICRGRRRPGFRYKDEDDEDEAEETAHGNSLVPRSANGDSRPKPRPEPHNAGSRENPPRGFGIERPPPLRYGYDHGEYQNDPTGNNPYSSFYGGRGRMLYPFVPPREIARRNYQRQLHGYRDEQPMSPPRFYGVQHDPQSRQGQFDPRGPRQPLPPSRYDPSIQGIRREEEYISQLQQALHDSQERIQALEERNQVVERQLYALHSQLPEERRHSSEHTKQDQNEKHVNQDPDEKRDKKQ